ncbi:MAG: hypothetical protein Q8L34_04865, partial [Candidatus Woesearchaeota archaeon]|nr:hypothetical protein [Candidatus Woesearchaeota archaeon]
QLDWKNMSSWDLIHYVRSNYYGYSIGEFKKSKDSTGYQECRTREFTTEDGRTMKIKDFLVEEGTLIRKTKPKGFWQKMSDWDLIHYVRSNHYGDSLGEFQKSNYQGCQECGKREFKTEDGRKMRLLDFLIEEVSLIDLRANEMNWKNMSDWDLIHYVRSNYYGYSIGEFIESARQGSQECKNREFITEDGRKMKIKDFLVEEGSLIDLYADRIDWKNMSDWDLIHYVRSNHYGYTITEFVKFDGAGYNECLKRYFTTEDGRKMKMIDFLVEEGSLIEGKRKNGFWKNMSDWDLIHYVRSNYYGDTLTEFGKSKDNHGYEECKKREFITEDGRTMKMKDFLIEEGTLIKKNGGYEPSMQKNPISLLESLLEDNEDKIRGEKHG